MLNNIKRMKNLMEDIRLENENHLGDIYEYVVTNLNGSVKVDYILDQQAEHDAIKIKALAHDELDTSLIYEIVLDDSGNAEHYIIPDWDFNVDDYLLTDLQEGYQIAYMSLEDHAGHRFCIDELRDDIHAEKGLQMYLSYCQEHGITQELLLSNGNKVPSIEDMYQEVNNGYKIIAEITIGKNAVVLGYNDKAPQQYASWETTRSRRRGFHNGHYFKDYDYAMMDFHKRCHEVLSKQIGIEKDKSNPKLKKSKEKHDGER